MIDEDDEDEDFNNEIVVEGGLIEEDNDELDGYIWIYTVYLCI